MSRTSAFDSSAENRLVMIIDAGHGGADGGAVAPDGTSEAEINLSVAIKLDLIAALFGTKTVLTRDSAHIDYPAGARTIAEKKVADQRSRLAVINGTPGAVLVSIHQNNFPSVTPHGAQTLYAATAGSKELALRIQELLISFADPTNTRGAIKATDDIYLMRNAKCPAIILECGYLSNKDEFNRLTEGGYQTRLAAAIEASWLSLTKELEAVCVKG